MVVNSTTDIVNALVAKGVLTEEEGALLNKGRTDEAAGQAKALKKASKLKVSDAIDNATIYGDVRIRYEDRQGTGPGSSATLVDAKRERARYKVTLGVKTDSGDWYTDLALAMGASGRSDNATFGKSGTELNDKEGVYIKRAMVGYKATDWLTLQAGRMENPLYTTPMVWDADLTMEGFSEQVKYKLNDQADLFGTALQSQYLGDKKTYNGGGTNTTTNELLAFQGGAKYTFNDRTSAKAAVTYTTYTNNHGNGVFTPGVNNATVVATYGVNDLNTIEIPAEINFMASSNIGLRLFGDYVYNTSGSDRAAAACAAAPSGAVRTAVCAAGNDDTAWMLGVHVGSAKDLKAFEGNKMVAGDWSARLWYQDVGVYSVDQNAVDSDFMDSRVNMKGTIFKGQYNIKDNVFANFAYGHGTRKNGALATAAAYGSGNDLSQNLNSYDLLQFDLTYKF